MSSYGHHTTASSFPADSGLLAAARNGTDEHDDDALDDSTRSNDMRPSNPSMASVKRKSSAISLSHERTPLLSPSVPTIREDIRERNDSDRFAVYFEELRILSKYTLPVFG